MEALLQQHWFRLIAKLLIVTTLSFGLPVTAARAGMIGTEAVVTAEQMAAQRARVQQFLERADVQSQLQKMGVDPAMAKSRALALTDQEIQQVAGKMDQMPAGGADVLVVILVIFLILLLTDILGFTQIFPFTKPIR
jgi:hypothetical protein